MQIERNIKITFRWWNDDVDEINPKHLEALEETAYVRIFDQIQEGYTSGELFDNIHMFDSDPEDGIEYEGWWELSYI